ncbi:hypothetical protein SAMN06265339_1291 [Desulfurobacterium pacificum]|uniref:DUF4397 domain-containing protein n=1 Tax=Desulfurobacterium pacificum TaxID=240166 RepID=A0ABY1NNE6_9BACT|nr:hypothetical protein [Desulfurobacterium pacificum]SMP14221.1 hypothetical protein SAMN06265339_1291 [Desulfurobacterium pacificum]
MRNLRTKLAFSSLCIIFLASCGSGNISSNTSTTASGSIYDAFIKGLTVCPEGSSVTSPLCNQTNELGKYTIKNYSGGNLNVYLNTENGPIYLGTIPSNKVNNKVIKPTDFIFNGTENETIGLDLAIYLENLAQTCTTNSSITTWDFSSFNSSVCANFLPPEKNFYRFWERNREKLVYCLDTSLRDSESFANCMESNSTVVDETRVKFYRLRKKLELENSNPETLIESSEKLSFFKTSKELKGKAGDDNYTLSLKPIEIRADQIIGSYTDNSGNGTFIISFPFIFSDMEHYKVISPYTSPTITFINYPILVLQPSGEEGLKAILIHTINEKGFAGILIDNPFYSESPALERVTLSIDGSSITYTKASENDLLNVLTLIGSDSDYHDGITFSGGKVSYYTDDDILFSGNEGVAQDIVLRIANHSISTRGQGEIQVNDSKYYSSYSNVNFTYYDTYPTAYGSGSANFTFTPDMTFQIPCSSYMADAGICKADSNFILFISGSGYFQISCDNETIQNLLNEINNKTIYGIWGSRDAYDNLRQMVESVVSKDDYYDDEPEFIGK